MPAVFWNAAARRGDTVFMRQKHLGIWRSHTWSQTAQAVREIAHGLMALGFEPGECASILSHTVVDWVLADLAVLSCGGVSNGIYPTDSPAQVHYLCADSRTTVLFVEDEEQLDKVLEVRRQLPSLRKVVAAAAVGEFPMICLSAALSYFDSYRQARGTANLIQGQRDFFGAHTYGRVDREGVFHTAWAEGRAESTAG